MARSISEIAKHATSISEVQEGRTKVKNKEIVGKYPDGVTITSFDFINSSKNEGEKYPVFTIAEDDTIYVNGATVIKRVFEEIVDEYDGDVQMASRQLKKDGGLKVKFALGKTKTGDELVTVDIL